MNMKGGEIQDEDEKLEDLEENKEERVNDIDAQKNASFGILIVKVKSNKKMNGFLNINLILDGVPTTLELTGVESQISSEKYNIPT